MCAPRTQTKALRRRRHWPIAASTIDRLVKLRSLVDQTCFEFIDVSYFGAVNFLLQYCILLNKLHFGLLYAN